MLMRILGIPPLTGNSIPDSIDSTPVTFSLTFNALSCFHRDFCVIHSTVSTHFNCTVLPRGVRVKSIAPWPRLAIRIAAIIIIKALVRISFWQEFVPVWSLMIPALASLARFCMIHGTTVTFSIAGHTFNF